MPSANASNSKLKQEHAVKIIDRSMTIIGNVFIVPLAASSLTFATAAGAQEPDGAPIPRDEQGTTESKRPDLDNGLRIARKLCATCHLIGEPPNAAVSADVPSFPSIANRPNQSKERLTNWLIEPHTPMPNIHLTRTEIRDLAGYILSLRTVK